MAEEKKKKGQVKTKKKNPDTKSGRTYSLADFAAGKFSLDDAIEDTKFNKREGVIRSVDKKDPEKTAEELKSILEGATPKKPKKKDKKGYKVGGKVRGAGIARKGVRPAKMR